MSVGLKLVTDTFTWSVKANLASIRASASVLSLAELVRQLVGTKQQRCSPLGPDD